MNNTDDDTYNKIINYFQNYIHEIGICKNIIEQSKDLVIPINFWFNKDTRLSIPIVMLKYHDVRINIELKREICN